MALTKPQCDVSRRDIVGIDQIDEKTKESLTIVRLFCFACFPSSIVYIASSINATKIWQQWRRQQQKMFSDCKFEFFSLNYSCFIKLYLIVSVFLFQYSQSTYVSQSNQYRTGEYVNRQNYG